MLLVCGSAVELPCIDPGGLGPQGGNMDNRHLCVGCTAFFPVAVPGALFSCGDGHAAQGDGEVAGSAIETGMFCRMRLTVLKPVRGPATHHISHSVHPEIRCCMPESVAWS